VEKIKTHILCWITVFRKSCGLWNHVQKYGGSRAGSDGNIIRRRRFTCWISKATRSHAHANALSHPHTHTHTHTYTHTHTHTYTHTHTHTHKEVCNMYCFCTATIFLWRAAMLRYSYIVSPFQNCFLLSFRQIRALSLSLSLSLCICLPPSPSGPLLALLVTNYLGFVDRSVGLDDLEKILVCPVLNFHIQPSGVDLLASTGADRSWASHR
jgi:hypothetical protein